MTKFLSTDGLIKNSYIKLLILIGIGGFAYCGIEVLSRGYSHISMFLLGGLCFFLVGGVSYLLGDRVPLVVKMLIGTLIITLGELLTGMVVNMWLGMDVWDYSSQKYNYLGQICLMFSAMWFLLTLPIIGLYKVINKVL